MKKKILIVFIIFVIVGGLCLLVIDAKGNNNSGDLVELNYVEINNKIDNEEDFILVVSQSTCSHCATYRPKVKKIASEYGINVYYIDYDKEASGNQVKLLDLLDLDGATPTTLFIRDGEEVSKLNRLIGDLSETKIVDQFKKMGFIE